MNSIILNLDKNKKNFEYTFIFILSLIPLLWWHKGYMINGGDINYPIILENRFNLRFHSWNDFFIFGNDRSVEITTLFFHIPDLIGKYILKLNHQTTQIFSYFIWNLILILSFNYFIKNISNCRIFHFYSILVFSLNYYLFFAWKALQYNILSIILFILIFTFIINIIRQRFISKQDVLKIFFSYILLPTYSIQTPVIYVFYFFIFLYLFLLFIFDYKKFHFFNFFYLKIFFVIVLLSICSSFYWVINLGNFIITSVFTVGDPLNTFSIDALLKWCSKEITILSSFLNMSDIAFFGEFNGKYFLTMFKKFFGLADILPMIIYLICLIVGFLLCINLKDINFRIFAIFFLISLIFSSGVRPPFGIIYQLFVNHLPGFFVIRAPWMKWGFVLTISSSILIGVFFSQLFKKINNKKKYFFKKIFLTGLNLKIAITIIFVSSHIFHTEYYIKGYHFADSKKNTIGFPHMNDQGNYMKIPEYIHQMTSYINEDRNFSRVLFLPLSNSNNYKWGFGGPTDITTELLVNKGAIFLSYGEGQTFEDRNIGLLIKSLREEILHYNEKSSLSDLKILNLSEELGIKYYLYRKDFNNYFIDRLISNNKKYKYFIEKNKFLKKSKSFGEWDLYAINNYKDYYVYCIDNKNNKLNINYKKLSPDYVQINKIDKDCKKIILNNSINKNWVMIREDKSFIKNFISASKTFLSNENKISKKLTKNQYRNVWEIKENEFNFSNEIKFVFFQQYLKIFGFFITILSTLAIIMIKDSFWRKIK